MPRKPKAIPSNTHLPAELEKLAQQVDAVRSKEEFQDAILAKALEMAGGLPTDPAETHFSPSPNARKGQRERMHSVRMQQEQLKKNPATPALLREQALKLREQSKARTSRTDRG